MYDDCQHYFFRTDLPPGILNAPRRRFNTLLIEHTKVSSFLQCLQRLDAITKTY